jgi:hypothetical protein
MKTIQLITAKELKQHSDVAANVEDTKLGPSILRAQNEFLAGLLGEDAYALLYAKRLITGVWSGLTDWQTAFVDDFVTPYLIHKSAACLAERHGFDMSNVGISRVTTDKTAPAPLHELKYLVDSLNGQADTYASRLQAHLKCQDRGTDPLVDAYLGTDDQNPNPSRKAPNLPIYFPSCE